jgi:predicted metal-binding protein
MVQTIRTNKSDLGYGGFKTEHKLDVRIHFLTILLWLCLIPICENISVYLILFAWIVYAACGTRYGIEKVYYKNKLMAQYNPIMAIYFVGCMFFMISIFTIDFLEKYHRIGSDRISLLKTSLWLSVNILLSAVPSANILLTCYDWLVGNPVFDTKIN